MNKKVRHQKWYGTIMVLAAGFILSVSFIYGASLNTITGILLLILGINYLSRPALEYNENEIISKSALGISKTYQLSGSTLSVTGGRVYINNRKLPLATFIIHKGDYKRFLDFLKTKIQNSKSAEVTNS
ncbi:MAG: hypothetical protein MRY83_19705 [Flavobacteriales bacterium]|nr:hypothetical protein [Flavobacteriales bacterium]